MIDDEKIKKAIEDYVKYSSVEDEYPGTEGNAFKAGAKWSYQYVFVQGRHGARPFSWSWNDNASRIRQ